MTNDTSATSMADRTDYRDSTLGDFLTIWLPTIAPGVRPSTFSSYSGIVIDHLIPHLGENRLVDLTPMKIAAFLSELAISGNRRGKVRGPLSARTVRYCHTLLRRALSDAVAWGVAERNPAALVKAPRNRVPSPKTWSAEELGLFLASVKNERLYAAWMLLATTGMRRGEVLGLGWPEVDLTNQRLQVTKALVCVRYTPQVSDPKTARGRRAVELDPSTNAVLGAHRTAMEGEGQNLAGWVFCDKDGSPVHPVTLGRMFNHRVKREGLPRIRLHDLRHTYASIALSAGIHPKIVSERLGHANVTITLDTYSHVLPSLHREAAEKVAGLIVFKIPS